ncbi:MAG: restriction endonuclease subunit S, partial [Candidatus Heimdallarchaeota archaeon]
METFEETKLPEGWVWARLEDIAKKINPGFPSGKHNKECLGVPHLRPMNINIKGEIELSEVKYVQPDSYDSLLKGDVLFNNTNSPKLLGKTSYIKNDTNWAYSNHMTRIRLNSSFLNSAWISYYIHSLFLSGFFKMSCTHHVNQASINSTFLSQKVPIPIPPLPEQRAIVSKIEQLFSDLDNGIDNFKKAQEQLKRYRQPVLKAACEGKLVPTEAELARVEGRDYEPADVLLARILKERREKWNGKGKYKEPTAPDTNGLPELPEGWILGRLENIAEINPKLPDNDYSDNMEVSFLPMRVVEEQTGRFDLSINKKYIEVKKGYTSFMDEDIIFAKITPCMENGKIAIVDKLKNGIGFGSTEFHVIRLYGNQFIKKYLFFYLVQKTFRNEAQRNMTGSAGQLRVPTNYIRQTLLPLPPLAEQHRIVVEVERRLSLSDKMETTIAESLQKAESLRQSILKKAFEGKLLNEKELEEARNALDW